MYLLARQVDDAKICASALYIAFEQARPPRQL